ncbi:MAG: oligosaccharide flippase family protein [Solirubrobacteraceae bacterium]
MPVPGAPDSPPSGSADAGATAAGTGGGILANVTYSLISLLSSGVFTAILTLYLVRALAPSQYGDFALAVGIGALVALPGDFGVSSSTARFVAEHRADPPGLAAVLADGVRLELIASAVACGALAALADPIAAAFQAPLSWPLRVIAVAVLGQNLMVLFERSFIAAGRASTYVRVAFGESAMECSASVVLVLLGGGALVATAGRALGYIFGALLALILAARAFGWPAALRRPGRRSNAGRIARYAVPLMLVDGATVLFSMVDVLLIGVYLGTKQVGLFSAPVRLLPFFYYPSLAVANGVAPRMARGLGNEPDGAALAGGLRGLVLFYSLLLAPLIIWTRPIVDILLGGNYGGSITTLRVLSISVYLGGIAPLVSVSANFLGDARSRIPLMIGAALLDGAIDVVLIPRIGIVSGAIATAAAFLVMNVGHLAICARHVKLPFSRIAVTALRALAAAASMAIVLALIGTRPSIPMLIVGAVLGTMAFLLALVVLQELSRPELTKAWLWTRTRVTLLRH